MAVLGGTLMLDEETRHREEIYARHVICFVNVDDALA